MNDRDRFVGCLLGKEVDRPPYWLRWSPWATTRRRWEREGKPPGIQYRDPFNPDAVPQEVPVELGPYPPFQREVIEEDQDYVTFIDRWGIKRRDYKGGTSMSQFLEFPIKNRDDWERYREERLDPEDPGRLAGDWRERCAEWMEKGWPIQLGNYPDVTLYGGTRWLLGDEECLLAFYTMPDLVHDIMDHLTDLYLAVFERVVEHVRVDVIHIWEDMCGRQGPLISPDHWREFMGPNYRRIKQFADRHDIPLISVDTDGYPDPIIPTMMEAGVNYLWPFEVAAGCDVNVFGARYPTLGMMGGIDKRALAEGPEAIDAELERVRPAVEAGRYIPALDHCVPDDVSWHNYSHYAEALRELVGKQV
ncbi:MAG: uroporphyrinogen decarboxylase family protein [Candidatus Brocadiia bacterium]